MPLPAVSPASRMEEYGVEDARITQIDGVFHITYVSVSRLGITTSRLTTTDFRTFERHGVMLYPDQKDVVLFPERVGDRYLSFTRPMPGSFSRVLGIWLAESADLVHWGRHRPVALPRPGLWDEARIGASLTPFRVDDGWLEVYHGADRTNRYGMGALLFDADDPGRVLARSRRPLLGPRVRLRARRLPPRRGVPQRARAAGRRGTHPHLLRRRRLAHRRRPTVVVADILASLEPC